MNKKRLELGIAFALCVAASLLSSCRSHRTLSALMFAASVLMALYWREPRR